jgi:hypothetical protein
VRLPKLLRPSAPSPPARRRRRPRADAPRTIVPVAGDPAAPAPGPDAPFAVSLDAARERQLAPQPFNVRLDEARSRLRRAIPPVADDER